MGGSRAATSVATIAGTAAAGSGASAPSPSALIAGTVASYIAQLGDLTLDVSDVDAWANNHNPGTLDLDLSAAPPLWLPTGGVDGNGGVQFDGVSEYGVATGFTLTTGDRPSWFVVAQWVGSTVGSRALSLQRSDAGGYSLLVHLANNYRHSSSFLGAGSAAIDLGDGIAESPRVGHLHEFHHSSGAAEGVLDGTGSTGGTGGALNTAVDRLVVGAFYSGVSYVNHCEAIVSEVVIVDDPSTAEKAAYRTQRAAVRYPTIGAALPP